MAVKAVLLISFLLPKLIVQFNRHLLFFINVFELHQPRDFFEFIYLFFSGKSDTQEAMRFASSPAPLCPTADVWKGKLSRSSGGNRTRRPSRPGFRGRRSLHECAEPGVRQEHRVCTGPELPLLNSRAPRGAGGQQRGDLTPAWAPHQIRRECPVSGGRVLGGEDLGRFRGKRDRRAGVAPITSGFTRPPTVLPSQVAAHGASTSLARKPGTSPSPPSLVAGSTQLAVGARAGTRGASARARRSAPKASRLQHHHEVPSSCPASVALCPSASSFLLSDTR